MEQVTVTLYDIIQSELINKGFNEFVDNEGNLIFFKDEYQFMTKIFSYDADISSIMDKLFTGLSLNQPEHDHHFKKAFLFRFLDRRINRQTIEAFKLLLYTTFLSNQDYMNRVYKDLELYLLQTKTSEQKNNQSNIDTSHQTNVQNTRQLNTQTNKQDSDGTSTTDNRDAESTLPQDNVQLDVNSTVMDSANTNRISRNKQLNNQKSIGETSGENTSENDSITSGRNTSDVNGTTTSEYKDYNLEQLFKTNGLHDQIYSVFDGKCFMQTW